MSRADIACAGTSTGGSYLSGRERSHSGIAGIGTSSGLLLFYDRALSPAGMASSGVPFGRSGPYEATRCTFASRSGSLGDP